MNAATASWSSSSIRGIGTRPAARGRLAYRVFVEWNEDAPVLSRALVEIQLRYRQAPASLLMGRSPASPGLLHWDPAALPLRDRNGDRVRDGAVLEERDRGVRELDVSDGRRPHRVRTRTRRRRRCNRLNREAERAVPRRQLVARAPCTREAEALTRRNISARVGAGHVRNAACGDVDAEGRAAEAGDLTGALEERSLVGTCRRPDEVGALRGRGGAKRESRPHR